MKNWRDEFEQGAEKARTRLSDALRKGKDAASSAWSNLVQDAKDFTNNQGMAAYGENGKNARPTYSYENGDFQKAYDDIMNRKDFSFDLNGDALYQQYKDMYTKQGQLGMMDAMGQAAAATGGYGSSYAAAAGQQAYQQSLENLNAHIPELYQMAMQKYQLEGDNMAQRYAMLADDRDFAYRKYRDEVGDWEGDRAFAYQQERDAVGDSQWERQFNENNRQWQAAFDEDVRQYNQNYARSVYENDRDYDRSVFESDRNYDRSVFESDRAYDFDNKKLTQDFDKWWQEFNYGKEQDAIKNNQWQQTFNYGKEQDAIKNNQWQQTFDYGKERDAVADSQWQQTFDYGKERDKVDDQKWGAEMNLKYDQFGLTREQYEQAKYEFEKTYGLQLSDQQFDQWLARQQLALQQQRYG